jgi:hypothetical protein
MFKKFTLFSALSVEIRPNSAPFELRVQIFGQLATLCPKIDAKPSDLVKKLKIF